MFYKNWLVSFLVLNSNPLLVSIKSTCLINREFVNPNDIVKHKKVHC